MAIKDPLMFITIEEFKNWKGFNKSLFDEVTTPDSEIRYAIEIASSNIDFLSGFTISKKWPEINTTKFTDNIQTATTHYVNFLLGKGVEYARGQASIGQGGITYSQNNPEDPYYIVPQVFNYLKEINEYPIMQGFNLNVSSKQNWFKKFMGNGGEQNPWEIYVQFTNIKSSDDRTKITITHPKNIMGSVLDIDTRGIKSFDNLTTLELFTKYFSNDTMKLVNGKEGQEKKVISATGGNSLWEINIDNPNFINAKDNKGISANDKRIIDVGTPTFLTDGTPKQYVDDLVSKKQDKENWKIIGKSLDNRTWEDFALSFNKYYRVFITWDKPPFNQTSVKLKIEFKSSVYIGGEYMLVKGKIDNEDSSLIIKLGTVDGNKSQLIIIGGNKQYGNIFSLEELQDTIKVDIQSKLQIRSGSLTTNEIEENIWDIELKDIPPTPSPNIPQWKEVGTKQDNKTINYNFVKNKRYRIYYNYCETETNKTYGWLIKEFLYEWVPSGDDLYLEYFKTRDDNNTWLLINFQKIYMVIAPYPFSFGKLFKLEELQE